MKAAALVQLQGGGRGALSPDERKAVQSRRLLESSKMGRLGVRAAEG